MHTSMSHRNRRIHIMPQYKWNAEFANYNTQDTPHTIPVSFVALKSCMEADEPELMADLLGDYKCAHIYALILCCAFIPSVNCIEYLISVGTPMNETFADNPFQCTVQEYLDIMYNTTTNKMHWKARSDIYAAIQRGDTLRLNNETVAVDFRENALSSVKSSLSASLFASKPHKHYTTF